MLKFWAFIFRRTGYKHSSICAAELACILDNIEYIEQKYLEVLEEGPEDDGFMMSLDNIIGLEIGMFQAQHGITIDGKYMTWGEPTLSKRILIAIRRFLAL